MVMSKHILVRHLMPIGEEPRQFPPGPYTTEYLTQTSTWKRVFNPILQNTARSFIRFNSVSMLPMGKRPGDLDISELDSCFIVTMFGDPLLGNRTEPHTQHHSPTVFNATATLNNFHRLPGRREALERPRLRVPLEDLSRWRGNMHPADKNLRSHDILPNTAEPDFFSA